MNDEKYERYIGPAIVDAIVRLGRAQERLQVILDKHIPDTISKHDPEWHSEHEREGEKLYDARCTINGLHSDLWDLVGLLSNKGNVDESI